MELGLLTFWSEEPCALVRVQEAASCWEMTLRLTAFFKQLPAWPRSLLLVASCPWSGRARHCLVTDSPAWPEVAWLSPQLGRGAGPPLLQLLLDLLRRLVLHCAQLDAQNREKCEAARAEADLFLDVESAASLELAGDTVPWLCLAVLNE